MFFSGKLKENVGDLDGIHLIMAGGYDERVTENKEHYEELCDLAEKSQLRENITFLRSFSDSQKRTLLKYSTCLIYTPDREHFGIVPIEAMYMRCPVIAVKSGGPLETVAHEQTGYLCEPYADSFAEAMQKIVNDEKLRETLGNAGHERVISKFSFETFTEQLNDITARSLVKLWQIQEERSSFIHRTVVVLGGIMVLGLLFYFVALDHAHYILWSTDPDR